MTLAYLLVALVAMLAAGVLGSVIYGAAAWAIRQHVEWAELRRFQRLRTALNSPSMTRSGRGGR